MNVSLYNERPLYQWDTGRRLLVDDLGECSEVHFCNQDDPSAIVCPVYAKEGLRLVDVPNILLQSGAPVTAYLFCRSEDGTQTRYAKRFPIRRRPKPEDYIYTQTEVLSYKTLAERIDRLESDHPELIAEAVNDALTQAKESGAFKGDKGEPGKTPVKGVDYFTEKEAADIAEQAAGLIDLSGIMNTEEWSFELEDGTTVIKQVVVK